MLTNRLVTVMTVMMIITLMVWRETTANVLSVG